LLTVAAAVRIADQMTMKMAIHARAHLEHLLEHLLEHFFGTLSEPSWIGPHHRAAPIGFQWRP
jgi:hypothetical protein